MPRETAAATSAKTKEPSYEEAVAELERLVQRMEDGQLPLDQLLDATSGAPNCSSSAAPAWQPSRSR